MPKKEGGRRGRRRGRGRFYQNGGEACSLDARGNFCGGTETLVKGNTHLFRYEIDGAGKHARLTRDGLFHGRTTGRAVHPFDAKKLFCHGNFKTTFLLLGPCKTP